MLLAERGDLISSVERMYFDLVDGWVQSRFRREKLLQLERVHKRLTEGDNYH